MKKLIKNYTTQIPTQRTISEIQELLSQNGARGIAVEYDEAGNTKDIFFKIIVEGKELPFRLPSRPEAVYQQLFSKIRTQWGKEEKQKAERYKKAEMIAWRICKLWLEAQITLVNLSQAKMQEVFLPYLVIPPGNKTLYETMEKNQFMLKGGE